jgi:glycosyltransferase involved in cell wall biosynthesis
VNREAIHLVLPNDIDDPFSPSGGNVYDRRICRGLVAAGWPVREHAVRGAWPQPRPSERAGLARTLGALGDGSLVLVDGLIASAVPEVLGSHAERLRLVVLVHMPLGDDAPHLREAEGRALGAATAIVTTSHWCRTRLLELYPLDAGRIHPAPPGVDASPPATGSPSGSRLLCVAAVTAGKGHDVLVEALAGAADRDWSCTCVGSLDRDADFAGRVTRRTGALGLADRVAFVGPRTGADLEASYGAADLLVLATRGETYGMVVTEALARGIPVLASAVKGGPAALGRAPDGGAPGTLVAPDDPAALTVALRRWLTDPDLRDRLRASARARRTGLADWSSTSDLVSRALSGLERVAS